MRFVGTPRSLVKVGGYPEFDWTKDSHSLVYLIGGHCWRISTDGRHRELLAQAVGDTLAIARHRDRLAYSTASPLGSTITKIHRARRETAGSMPIIPSSCSDSGPQYSDDGRRIVFVWCSNGGFEVSVCSSEATNCLQLTSFGYAGSPRFSPDGRYVAFDSAKYGSWDIFVIASGGGSPRRLTFENSADSRPSWSRDGKWIYFGSDRSGNFQIWRIPAGGGTAEQVTRDGGFEAVEGRDGHGIYYVKRGEQGIWTAPVGGGRETLVLNRGEEGMWALGAGGIYLLSKGTESAIDYFDFDKGSLSRVRTLPSVNATAMFGVGPEFAVSLDERSFLYCAAVRNEKDLMLLENFRWLALAR
jgi:hypothetical protein